MLTVYVAYGIDVTGNAELYGVAYSMEELTKLLDDLHIDPMSKALFYIDKVAIDGKFPYDDISHTGAAPR